MSTSLKVPVSLLIANAEAERKRLLDEYERAARAYKDDEAEVRAALVRALSGEATLFESGKRKLPKRDTQYDYKRGKYVPCVTVCVTVPCVPKPERPDRELREIDRDLRLLQATSQETISVRADAAFSRYL